MELLSQDGEANPFVGVQVLAQAGKQHAASADQPTRRSLFLGWCPRRSADGQKAQVEEIIEQIVTPFCVELCAEVDKLYSVNQVFSMARVHMRGRLWDLDR